jgi:CBS domain-containing protein
MKASEIMTTSVITTVENETVAQVARLMAHHRISGLPVVDIHGKLVGLVTEYDLISRTGQTVGEIMTPGVISVSPDTDMEEVTHLLTNRRIRRVLVMDGDVLAGIVSRSDLVKHIAMRWVCPACGETLRTAEAPDKCPRCHAPNTFVQDRMQPGM